MEEEEGNKQKISIFSKLVLQLFAVNHKFNLQDHQHFKNNAKKKKERRKKKYQTVGGDNCD